MKMISAQDASLLALLAEKPSRKSRLRKKVLQTLGTEALDIAAEMGRKNPVSDNDAAVTASGLKIWAKTNKSARRGLAARQRSKK